MIPRFYFQSNFPLFPFLESRFPGSALIYPSQLPTSPIPRQILENHTCLAQIPVIQKGSSVWQREGWNWVRSKVDLPSGIVEWFGLEGKLKIILFQPLGMEFH